MALVALRMAARAVKPHSALPAAAIARQRQHLSSESAGKKTDAQVELYESPLARPVRTLKTVSVTSASLTMVFLPASLFVGNPELALMSKLAISTTVCAFAAATTGVLHYVSRAYVRNIRCSKSDVEAVQAGTADLGSVQLQAEMLNFFGLPYTVSFPAGDVAYPPDRPVFHSFTVGDRPFFVHGELVTPHPVLSKLLPGVTAS